MNVILSGGFIMIKRLMGLGLGGMVMVALAVSGVLAVPSALRYMKIKSM